MFRAAQASAFLARRDYVLPDDVQDMAPLVLLHRVAESQGRLEAAAKHDLIRDLVQKAPVPV